jgi:hypothetical protein
MGLVDELGTLKFRSQGLSADCVDKSLQDVSRATNPGYYYVSRETSGRDRAGSPISALTANLEPEFRLGTYTHQQWRSLTGVTAEPSVVTGESPP